MSQSARSRAEQERDLERKHRNAQTARRKARLERRRNALLCAVEGLFVARGWSIKDAAQMAAWWVADKLEMARRVMQKLGFDYWESAWNTPHKVPRIDISIYLSKGEEKL